MTQERADKMFNTPLGSQLTEIFVTSDDRAFIRWEEADKHRKGQLDEKTLPLLDQTITEWCPSCLLENPEDSSGVIVHADSSKQDLISITSVDNLHLHIKSDGSNLAEALNEKVDGKV